MSMQPASKAPQRNLIRDLANQAASHPRIEAAVLGAIRAELPGVIESLLREAYGGEQLRLYVPKRDAGQAAQARDARDRRIRALAAPPGSLSVAAIAAQERITPHRVRQILRAAGAADGNGGA